ncbi:MAG TPA: hypothetical protein VHE34_00865 [Puia sp.]|uniref:hypothetical protein n=1 Tax=Puia sp. TaxID=2045100 RepID=UPI002BDF2CFA|nr:hypothetical protein [Puia sp.]HVU93735.1 hypothetical protein [Puia sp.]
MLQNSASNPYSLLHEGNPTIRQSGPIRVLPEPLKRLTKIWIVWEATGRMKDFSYNHKFSIELTTLKGEIVLIVDFIVERVTLKGYNLVLLYLLFWKEDPPQIIPVRLARYCIDLRPDEFHVTDAITEK